MWPFGSSTEPPVVEVRVDLNASKCLVNINHFKKAIKSAIPSITVEEMEVLLDDYRVTGCAYLRVTKKAVKVLKKYEHLFRVNTHVMVEIEDACRCGNNICSSCITDVKESRAYSKTNNGIIRDHDSSREFNEDTGEALIRIAQGGKAHVRVW